MKKYKTAKLWLTCCLVVGMIMTPLSGVTVQAAEIVATVQGTVMKGTTAELLKLSTKEGDMEIKLDSGTDTSECKILLPDNKVSVSVSHGSDGYLHAVKLSTDVKAPGITLDSSTTATVTGTVGEKTKGDIIYFKTSAGEMEIKLDTTTNMSGCSVLVVDKTYTITCVRGSDAYMHATSISDSSGSVGTGTSGTSGSSGGVSYTPAPTATVTESTTTVTGTVGSNTKEDLLYLSTGNGEMQIVIDGKTDSRSGLMLTPGSKLAVAVYRGSDAYMHAASITGAKESTWASQVDTSSPATVTGTVGSKSTENILYLHTSYGDMELKMDTLNSVTGCKVLVSGKKITITCARGSDAYMHVLTITGN